MRKSLFTLLTVSALLASSVASAFDPDTPVGDSEPAFPITLGSDEDTTIDLAFRAAFGLARDAAVAAVREIDGRRSHFLPATIHMLPQHVRVLLTLRIS